MKIVVANIYFGQRPGYFDIFLRSCSKNPAVDFMFLVDFEIPDNVPSNVRFVKTSFAEIRSHFQSAFDFPISLTAPYKLTDFQPAYGELLAEYFVDYNWWGHCDFDMVFGDLSPILEAARNANYAKILRRGHLTLYRNSPDVNAVYRSGVGSLDFRSIFSSERFHNFDETNGIDRIFSSMQLAVFREEIIADIVSPSPFLFMTAHSNRWGQYFVWSEGKLRCVSPGSIDREFIYIHLQKRRMAELYHVSHDCLNDIVITQFGFSILPPGTKGRLCRMLAFVPNLAHMRRYFFTRLQKALKLGTVT